MKEHIMIRGWLNQFSDRWPDVYANLHTKINDPIQFQITILWNYIKWAKPDMEDVSEILSLIQLLDNEDVGDKKVRYKVDIEEVTDGRL